MTESSEQNARIQRIGQRHILYDAALIEHPDVSLFSPSAEQTQSSQQKTAAGRGEAVFFKHHGLNLVLKHYHRGGMVARFMGDRYFGFRPGNSRSFKEWQLLGRLQLLGLPAPVPVAASMIQRGVLQQADLVTKEIPDVTTLADILSQNKLSAEDWQAIGLCIRQFHNHDVFHADLNARNILLDQNAKVYLVDFDKGCIRVLGESWKASNLARLKRSLLKFKSNTPGFNFDEQDWSALLKGYATN